jgi:hypothetical protein
VNIELCRELDEPVSGNDSLCNLPLVVLPLGKIGFRILVGFLGFVQEVVRDGLHPVSRSRKEEYSSS